MYQGGKMASFSKILSRDDLRGQGQGQKGQKILSLKSTRNCPICIEN